MERENALRYLERKGKLNEPLKTEERQFTKEEEELIQKVMKEGKIFGDPVVILKE